MFTLLISINCLYFSLSRVHFVYYIIFCMCFRWRRDNKVDVITSNFTVYTIDRQLYATLPTTLPICAHVEIVKEHIVSKLIFLWRLKYYYITLQLWRIFTRVSLYIVKFICLSIHQWHTFIMFKCLDKMLVKYSVPQTKSRISHINSLTKYFLQH